VDSKKKENGKRQKLVVLGAGPGGYPAAFRAAQLGFEVTLIDPRKDPGGVCLYEGCIPSKALLRLARQVIASRECAEWGIHFEEPRLDIDQMRNRLEKAVERLTQGLGQLSKTKGVSYIQGTARFTDEKTLSVSNKGGDDQSLDFDRAIIATGSRPLPLPGADPRRSAIWDSSSALALKTIPSTLLVVGGGYIGLEMGTLYSALGSRVTVVEMEDKILPGVDTDLSGLLWDRLAGESPGSFEKIVLEGKVSEPTPTQNGIKIKLTDGDGGESEQEFEKMLVAIGRKPNTEDLGLKEAGVDLDDDGYIKIDRQCRTSADPIFAIGDVAGQPMLAHKASRQGHIAAESAWGQPTEFDGHAIPAVVFTDPEIAWVGLTEAEAKRRNLNVEVIRFPWAASGRAVAMGRSDGLTKLIFEKRSERILGAGISGMEAGELIAEAALAIEMGARAEDLAGTIHPHPTFSETLMEAAHAYLGHSAHYQP